MSSEVRTATTELNSLGYPLLQCKSPVPTDIQISHDIVKDVGLLTMQEMAQQYVLT
jgi:hypothetical protein